MALLTDGNPNGTDDLRAYETAILSVASTESIDLEAKLGLATEEISEDILDVLLDHTRAYDPQANVRRMIGVSDVVVSDPLRRWHALHTLEVVYRDAFNNQLNDRYRMKWAEYQELAREARERTFRYGIGVAMNPVPRADVPKLATVPGQGAAATYWVQVSWVSATGQEGSPSKTTAYQTAGGDALVVQPVNPPAVAAGWNVYVGLTETGLSLQNGAVLGVGQTFTVPSGALAAGRAPGGGQSADIYITGGRMLRRG
jgi:hypothetical protein